MQKFEIEIKRIKKFDFATFRRILLSRSSNLVLTENRKQCMSILSDILKKKRNELFDSHSGYRIITDGNGALKKIEFPDETNLSGGTLDDIRAEELLERIKNLPE